MTKEEFKSVKPGARVKIWNYDLEEYEYGEYLRPSNNLHGFVEVCIDDDYAPFATHDIYDVEILK